MYGITFGGKHSYHDMGFSLAPGKSTGQPAKKKILVSVPFSNQEYDFSRVYGSQVYDQRELSYPFNVYNPANPSPQSMQVAKTKLINWLSGLPKGRLYDDTMPGYYYLAELDGDASFEDDFTAGILTAKFRAYSFMIAELPEGNDLWDSFNFELDVAQTTKFTVNGSLSVTLLNVGGTSVQPDIKVSAPMTLRKGDITLNVPTGTYNSDELLIEMGQNDITITGTGTIEFLFYKEMI
jgi:hypothetical protein